MHKGLNPQEEKCCVCLENIYVDPDNKPFWTLGCGHQYHTRCLMNCFDQEEFKKTTKKCFICRKIISNYDLDAIEQTFG